MAEFYTGFPRLSMKLETIATSGPTVVRDAVHSAISVAAKLNVWVEMDINGVTLLCAPDDDLDAKMDALNHAWEVGAKVIA